jgi:hypothetical protein
MLEMSSFLAILRMGLSQATGKKFSTVHVPECQSIAQSTMLPWSWQVPVSNQLMSYPISISIQDQNLTCSSDQPV